jgi:OHCU decarboxylase
MRIKISELNACPTAQFVAVCGPFYEHAPWIAERASVRRPFVDLDELHDELSTIVEAASADEQLDLVRAHPDLVTGPARGGDITPESAREQTAARLRGLAPDEVSRFAELNAAYRTKFGFPFIICARENKKDSILAAFPVRLGNTREQELRTALDEIAKIAKLRIFDALDEG